MPGFSGKCSGQPRHSGCSVHQKQREKSKNVFKPPAFKLNLMITLSQPSNRLAALMVLVALCLTVESGPVLGAELKQLHGHVPDVIKHLQPLGDIPATNELHLAIGVELHDSAGLDEFLSEVYNPASPLYRHFLTPDEFAARFSATEADYAAVKNFALANGFKISGTHGNRLLLDVTARASDVEKAFHIHLKKFKHPTEAREFFAPDAEPSVDAGLAVADVQGLSDYVRPRPKFHVMNSGHAASKNGSAPDGSGAYFGNDFRKAYLGTNTLTGAGQMVGLFQLDGFYPNDIAAYARQAGGGRTNIQVQAVLIGNTNWSINVNGGNVEVSLDIEMAMSMAPGLSKIMAFEAPDVSYVNTILNTMAASNMVKNLSCSWGWYNGPSTTTDNIFKTMASEGQSFFDASGDSCAFTIGAGSVNGVDNPTIPNAPSSTPWITQVGATTLTTGGGASYSSETVWNWNVEFPGQGYDGVGSSGGVSSYYTIPSWQTNSSIATNLGSTTQRNIPDVALVGDNVYVISGGAAQGQSGIGGTSCAAPLWAGFTALVNQGASLIGAPSPGLINSAVYAIGEGANTNYSYAACFHDTTTGNNFWSASPSQYKAYRGYDLCTGWGTPNGTLINALINPGDPFEISPVLGFAASGIPGGPFSGIPLTLTLGNGGTTSFDWDIISTSSWFTVSLSSGKLGVGRQTNVIASLSSDANSLPVGNYTTSVVFSNNNAHTAQTRQFSLQVISPLTVSPGSGFTASGPAGGNFNISSQTFLLTNSSASPLYWGIVNTSAWLTVSPPAGLLAANDHATCTVTLASSANNLPAGIYTANIQFTNLGTVAISVPFTLQVGQSLMQNGGFETGDFTGWTLSGDTASGGLIYNAVENSAFVTSAGVSYVHSGAYGAVLGESGSLATLSQSVLTYPGQSYVLSLWLINPTNLPVEAFKVNWNTNTSANTLYSIVNPSRFSWTNLTFIVTATGTNSTIQLAAENDNDYFGLDDVSLLPIPRPSFAAATRVNNGIAFTWNSLAGISYLVQYKTNLLQTNWINLFTNAATAGTTSFTNFVGAGQQRFYRIRQLP